MYPEKDIQFAAEILRRVAEENNVPEEEVRAGIREAIDRALRDPAPLVRARWDALGARGGPPETEDLVLMLSYLIKARR